MEAQPRISPVPEGTLQAIRVLMPSPIGPLGVEILGTAVTRLTIEPAEPELRSYIPLHQIDGSDFLDEVFGRLAEYFAGARRKLDLDFDLCASGINPFSRRVLKEAAKVPYGRTRTCREISEACGRHEGCPEVLAALRENPLPIVIPCHRVVADDGGLGDYVGGGRRKSWLLEMESQGLGLELL
jgi:methylated-DNA-[protein]-cysteine S-methyltransferase